MFDEIIRLLAGQGPFALISGVLLWLYVRSQDALRTSEAARVADAKAGTEVFLALQAKHFEAADRMEDTAEKLALILEDRNARQ